MTTDTHPERLSKLWSGGPAATARSAAERLEVLEMMESVRRVILSAYDFDGLDYRIVRVAAIADLQGRPHDLSSLAEMVSAPRPTVMRRVDRLARRDILAKEPRGRRRVVRCSDDFVESFGPVLDKVIERVVGFAERNGPGR